MSCSNLNGKTLFITGASRGIGLAIALRAARDGANIAVAAKTAQRHSKLPGTIYTAAEEIEEAGGKALPLVVDVRDETAVNLAVQKTIERFGGIDICVNNASAIDLSRTEAISLKRFDLLQAVNVRGTFHTSRACIPHLRNSDNPHILTLSPPLDFRPEWFAQHLPYTLSKYGMSLCVFGLARELAADGIACNALWPRTTIATAAVEFALGGEEMMLLSRRPEIVADAAYIIFNKQSATYTGQFAIDDNVLYEAGIRDFSIYQHSATTRLHADIFVDQNTPGYLSVQLDSSMPSLPERST
jgi:citronellol/citronellal dehydrogenase